MPKVLEWHVYIKDYAATDAYRRLRNNNASLIALEFVELYCWKLIARLNDVKIKDATAFVEGMRHNTHLQGLMYVPRWMGSS